MVEEDKVEDEAIHAKYPERVCYLCGRGDEELKIVSNELIKEFKQHIQQLENEKEGYVSIYKQKLQKILKETEKNNYLDFKVATVKSDLSKFGKIIPCLDELLEFYDKEISALKEKSHEWRGHSGWRVEDTENLKKLINVLNFESEVRKKLLDILKIAEKVSNTESFNESYEDKRRYEEVYELLRIQLEKQNGFTLLEIRNNIHKAVNTLEDSKIWDLKKQIDKMKFEKENVERQKYWRFELNEYTISFEDLFFDLIPQNAYSSFSRYGEKDKLYDTLRREGITRPKITVYICPICSSMFSRASRAAYDVIHSYDDYD